MLWDFMNWGMGRLTEDTSSSENNKNENKTEMYMKPRLNIERLTHPPSYLLGAAALFLIPLSSYAQQNTVEEAEVEEVVVTGSFIRNSQFTNSSPVTTISQDDLWQSGSANLGEYLRDLPYMENIDTVANLLDTQDGQQDSNSARFNLRGLGTESTLTLMDGRRAVNDSAVAALLPSIAQRSVEIVTDGGAALYGSDAVAGVANLIPYKEYEGFKARSYYKRDQEGSMEQSTLEMMTGQSFSFGLNWVGAFEYSNRTPLLAYERPKYMAVADQDSTSGWPGTYRTLTSAASRVDPSCETFNQGAEDLGELYSYPSGYRNTSTTSPRCILSFGEWQDFGRKAEGYTMFNNFTYDVTDWLDLEFQMSHNYRDSVLTSSPSSAVSSTPNLNLLIIPANHPANPFGAAVRPLAWRPFGKGGTLPSHLNSDGTASTEYHYYADAYKFGGNFEIQGTTWVGEAWVGYQQSRRTYDGTRISLSRMSQAMAGKGGIGGNEWFNPFASSDPRSPFYAEGITSNSQALVDWLHVPTKFRDTHDRLKYFDLVFNGEVYDLPNGTIKAAVGGQLRHLKNFEFRDKLVEARDDLYSNITSPLDVVADRNSGVRAMFAEVEVPILKNLGFKAAVRSEDFYSIGFSATKPKFSLIWEPLETLALRASYGESFLAPSASQLRPLAKEVCTEVADNSIDPTTGLTLNGVDSCTSGNPAVNAEESKIQNIGFSWRPVEGLSVDMDYQQIEYVDRISTLITREITTAEFNRYLTSNNLTASQYSNKDANQVAAALAWMNANPNVLITREAATGQVTDIYRGAVNMSSQFVDVYDLRVRYSFEVGDLGRFTASVSGNYYTRWEYQLDPYSPVVDGIGLQNGNTGLASPLAKFKANMGLGWFRQDHSANVSLRYTDRIKFDETTLTLGLENLAPVYINAITKVDARYSYRFNAFSADSNVTVGITNLFDRDAQRLPVAGGLESRVDDPFGRQFYISLDFEI